MIPRPIRTRAGSDSFGARRSTKSYETIEAEAESPAATVPRIAASNPANTWAAFAAHLAMAQAFALAVQAGRLARESGLGAGSVAAQPTSPLTGFLD